MYHEQVNEKNVKGKVFLFSLKTNKEAIFVSATFKQVGPQPAGLTYVGGGWGGED